MLAEEALLLAVAVEQPRLEERPGNNFSVPFQGWCFAEDFALWLLQAGNKALLQEVGGESFPEPGQPAVPHDQYLCRK